MKLNPAIARLERGEPTFGCFLQGGSVPDAVWGAQSGYDFVVYEMEHGPFNVTDLRLSLQFMLDRRQIAASGSGATPPPARRATGVSRSWTTRTSF